MTSGEKIGNSIVIKFPYNKDYVEKVKTIEGHRWTYSQNQRNIRTSSDITR